ncbi:hypothetical protein CGCSCA4_v010345 [Colletotrichum siamense]|uniref:Uncharacterized protein n=1 Tax=Colletotrichum siamense TaxID=690259 RepID=A0A9P5BS18_COLSI|nr:hypothetical protein CGCSCA5_v008873 [Colletotrichum siamense]KAF4840242.1 hypothetical protein CGCSCA4_v010345 [Colletotrichum siamense]KAF4841241.1 hypothetical protein CGCSCA2_v014914 [Colletotrichum siamense]KAF4871470.1 hypothetical protein CGCSCA1_v009227 [Colletotrichum siamense]
MRIRLFRNIRLSRQPLAHSLFKSTETNIQSFVAPLPKVRRVKSRVIPAAQTATSRWQRRNVSTVVVLSMVGTSLRRVRLPFDAHVSQRLGVVDACRTTSIFHRKSPSPIGLPLHPRFSVIVEKSCQAVTAKFSDLIVSEPLTSLKCDPAYACTMHQKWPLQSIRTNNVLA